MNEGYIPNNDEIMDINSCTRGSEEWKTKISNSLKGKNKHPRTEETKQKIRESGTLFQKGIVPWNKGKTGVYSLTSLKQMKESHKGQIAWNKGIPRTENEKKLMSDNRKGYPAWNKGLPGTFTGKHHTEENKRRWSKMHKGKHPSEKTKEKMREASYLRKREYESKLEKSIKNKLTNLKISYLSNKGIKGLLPSIYHHHKFDIIIEDKKIIIEVQGCYWHVCKYCNIIPKSKLQFKAIERDNVIRESIKNQSEWTLIELWEHDIKSDLKLEYLLKQKIPQLFGPKPVYDFE
jgi:G:T-mismatch repair DNA endonuclease (very short patch repair protein)